MKLEIVSVIKVKTIFLKKYTGNEDIYCIIIFYWQIKTFRFEDTVFKIFS